MTGFDYVLLGRSPFVSYLGTESRRDRAIVADVLERLDLVDLAERKLGRLSGGERQRLVIARALATEAPILVLDEPTSALDIGHQQQALDLVARLRDEQELTVIAAMHDLTLAGIYSDRLLLIARGAVAARGRPRDVLRPDLLFDHYGVRVDVVDHAGTLAVVPHRANG
jgi:iron complex transport system ATP-binding protein